MCKRKTHTTGEPRSHNNHINLRIKAKCIVRTQMFLDLSITVSCLQVAQAVRLGAAEEKQIRLYKRYKERSGNREDQRQMGRKGNKNQGQETRSQERHRF